MGYQTDQFRQKERKTIDFDQKRTTQSEVPTLYFAKFGRGVGSDNHSWEFMKRS